MFINYKSCAVYQADIPNYIFTVNPTPADAIVTLTAPGYTQAGNSITVPAGTNVSYSVAKSNCITTTGSEMVTSTHTTNVSVKCELTVNPTPSDATITLTASGYSQSGNTITVNYGTIVSCTISRTELETFTNNYTLTSNRTENVTLSYPSGTVLFESSTPGTYYVTPITPGTYNVICVGGGGGGASAYIAGNTANKRGTAAAVAGGGSGGYSMSNLTLNAQQYNIVVGSGGAKETYTTTIGNNNTEHTSNGVNGGNSSFSNLLTANGGNKGTAYAHLSLISTPITANATGTVGTGGSGITTNGNTGGRNTHTSQSAVYTGSIYGSGGSSVYSGKGVGGDASVDNGTAYASNGGSGYVKITAV